VIVHSNAIVVAASHALSSSCGQAFKAIGVLVQSRDLRRHGSPQFQQHKKMPKNRFSATDVRSVVLTLQTKLVGMRAANIYDINPKTYVIKFAQQDNKELLLLESGTRIHMTKYQRDKSIIPSGFTMKVKHTYTYISAMGCGHVYGELLGFFVVVVAVECIFVSDILGAKWMALNPTLHEHCNVHHSSFTIHHILKSFLF
jgi:hypothetical protein